MPGDVAAASARLGVDVGGTFTDLVALIDGDMAFRQHSGGHTTGPNWPTFLRFANRYIQGPPVVTKKPH